MKRETRFLSPLFAFALCMVPLFLSAIALGDDATAAAGALPVAADPAFVAWLQSFGANFPTSGIVITIGAIVVEFLCRFLKTQKPMSLLYIARNVFIYAGVACNAIGKTLDGIYQSSTEKVNPLPQALNSIPIKQDDTPQPMAKL